jgi:TonB-linked SusC/RagA family outer membrane protein
MKTAINGILTLFLVFTVQIAFAQSQRVSGMVINSQNESLLGATVLIKGTLSGAQTDFDGKYAIQASKGDVLVFSYLGYQSMEVTVGAESIINVTLKEDSQTLDQVIVLAQGIKAKPRALGYAVETLDSSDVTRAQEVNVVTALSAKVPGVTVTASSGSVGASANIRIRGSSSIIGNNSPLFVVDGVPIDNSSVSEADAGRTAGSDFSNRAVDLNSNDVESITILKGLEAQLLYGIRASNGVVLVTTKRGKAGKTRASITSHAAFSQYNKAPDLQNLYSQGGFAGGVQRYRGPETFEGDSWGPAISTLEFNGATDYPFDRGGRLVPSGTGNGIAARAYDPYDFFKTGVILENNFSVSGGTEAVRFRTSIGRLNQTGITPNEEFGRKTFTVNLDAKLNDRLDLTSFAQYTNSGGNRVQRGSNISGVMLGLVRTAPTFDNGNGLTGQDAADNPNSYYYAIDGVERAGQRSYRDGIYNNPYFAVNENVNGDEVNRIIGKMGLNYKVNDNMTLRSAVSVDQFTDVRKIGYNQLDASFPTGRVINDNISNQDVNWNVVLDGEKKISDKIGLTYNLGYDGWYTKSDRRYVLGDGLAIPGFFHISNAATTNNIESQASKKLIGTFATGTLSYEEMIYVTPSFRNDWSSTLPVGNNSFQSYSLGTSFVFTELMKESKSFLDYGKLRMSYGSTGNDAPLYATSTIFTGAFAGGDGFIQGVQFPAYDQVAFERGTIAGNPDLTPENRREFEIGTELKMFDGKLRFDATYYDRLATDVILNVAVAPSSGFNSKFANVAEISNKGFELSLSGTPIQTKDFSWDVNVNWTTYENDVIKLAEGVDQVFLAGFSSTSAVAQVGSPFSSIYGSRFARDAQGNVLIDDDGYPLAETTDGIVGDPTPDWLAGISNTFTYKDLSLSFLIDIRSGGDVWCGTCGILDFFGTSQATAARDQSTVFSGVVASTGQVNTQTVPLYDASISENNNYWRRYGFGGLSETAIYDASWVRLREVTLAYNLPSKWLSKIFISNASIAAYGRNLWLSTKYPGVDPETNLTGDSNGFGLDYFNQPNTKSYGLNLSLNF